MKRVLGNTRKKVLDAKTANDLLEYEVKLLEDVFENYGNTPLLPKKPYGFYREYYLPLPENAPNSPLRVLIGNDGKIWLSPDHYKSVIPLN